MNRLQGAVILGLGFIILSTAGYGQSVISARAGLIHYVEGDVYLKDTPVTLKFGQFPELKESEELRTEEGRSEMLLTPGTFLRMSENTSVRMLSSRLTDVKVEVLSGSVLVEVAELLKDNQITLRYKDSEILLEKAGLYRIDSDQNQLRVYTGEAIATANGKPVVVKGGRELTLTGGTETAKFDVKDTDAFYRWVGRRAESLSVVSMASAHSIYSSGSGWSSSGWQYNPNLGMFGFVPYRGVIASPFGYSFWSPYDANTWYNSGGYYGGGTVAGISRTNPSLGYATVTRTDNMSMVSSAQPIGVGNNPVSAPSATVRGGDSSAGRGGSSGGGRGK